MLELDLYLVWKSGLGCCKPVAPLLFSEINLTVTYVRPTVALQISKLCDLSPNQPNCTPDPSRPYASIDKQAMDECNGHHALESYRQIKIKQPGEYSSFENPEFLFTLTCSSLESAQTGYQVELSPTLQPQSGADFQVFK